MAKKGKKEVRNNFRRSVFKRDKYTCQVCGQVYSSSESDPSKGIINAHHITDRNSMPNGGYVMENGITVCDNGGKFPGKISCHMLVEQWHISGGDEGKVLPEHRPETLYGKIRSSRELAFRSSERLK